MYTPLEQWQLSLGRCLGTGEMIECGHKIDIYNICIYDIEFRNKNIYQMRLMMLTFELLLYAKQAKHKLRFQPTV